jgi:hypothetical protein
MLDLLIEKHQMYFEIHKDTGWALNFPFMFVKPRIGDKLRNTTTDEVYTVAFVEGLQAGQRRIHHGPIAREDKEDSFTGVIYLEQGNRAPRIWEDLEWIDKDRLLIQFFEGSGRNLTVGPSTAGEHDASEVVYDFIPSITWFVHRVEPASIGKSPFDPQKQLKPQLREEFLDPKHTYLQMSEHEREIRQLQTIYPTGQHIVTGQWESLSEVQQRSETTTHTISVYGQSFDNIVQFDCWSNFHAEANTLIFWFEDFMDLYTKVLKINGVQEILYWQRLRDQTVERWRDDIDNRTIRYYFKTEKLRVERTRNFRNFTFNVRVAHRGEALLTGEPIGISTTTGSSGGSANQFQLDNFTGYHFTGDGSYLWGQLDIQEYTGFSS